MKKRSVIIAVVVVVLIILLFFSRVSVRPQYFLTGKVSFAESLINPMIFMQSLGELFIGVMFDVDILSPLNITYYFSPPPNATYPLDLNVSSNRNITNWSYTLIDTRHNVTVWSNVSFTPNTSISAVRYDNLLIVQAYDFVGNLFVRNVSFYIHVNSSSPIIEYLPEEFIVCEGTSFSYLFNVTDIDEDSLTPTLNPTSPFFLRLYSQLNATRFNFLLYSGLLNKNDAGGVNAGYSNHSLEVSVDDGENTDYQTVNITVIEINNPPLITSVPTFTLWDKGDNSTLNYTVIVDDIEDGNTTSGNLSFNISFAGTHLFNISNLGNMYFNATNYSNGTYNVTVCSTDNGIENPHANISYCGQDGSNQTSCDTFYIVVTGENRAPYITSYYPINLTYTSGAYSFNYFNLTKHDPDGPPVDTYWYVDNNLIEFDAYDPNATMDEFIYQFGCGYSGVHYVKAVVSDGELNDSITWNVTVQYSQCSNPGGGGGGGGGGVRPPGASGQPEIFCEENWACNSWDQCLNLKHNNSEFIISSENSLLIKNRCDLFAWGEDICGFQIRNCTDLNFCGTYEDYPGFLRECYYTVNPTCIDGLKNCHDGGCEVLVDCGGPCKACQTCSDGILNQNEVDIDCGGICPPCPIEVPVPFPIRVIMLYFSLLIFVIIMVVVGLLIYRYYKKKQRYKELSIRRKVKKDYDQGVTVSPISFYNS